LPYLETRRYVQRVLGSYALYCALYPGNEGLLGDNLNVTYPILKPS